MPPPWLRTDRDLRCACASWLSMSKFSIGLLVYQRSLDYKQGTINNKPPRLSNIQGPPLSKTQNSLFLFYALCFIFIN